MLNTTKVVIFTSQRNAEDFRGTSQVAIISITDEGEANLSQGYGYISRHEFVDGAFDENTIKTHATLSLNGYDHTSVYGSYFNRDKANILRGEIEHIVRLGFEIIIVHCMAGKARSAAVAKYIAEIYGYQPFNTLVPIQQNQIVNPCGAMDFKHINTFVLRLLHSPSYYDHVIWLYSNQARGESAQPDKKRTSLLTKILSNFA